MPTQTKTQPQTVPVHHRFRTVLASLLGILAVFLLLSSIVAVWLNRTLTDTNTYVAVVAPLATKPEIQNFIAQKTSEQLVKNAPTQDLANTLLPNDPTLAAQTDAQIKAKLQPIVYNNVLKVVSAPTFATLWKSTNQTAHAALIKQLRSNSDTLSLDLHPIVLAVVDQLKTTTDLAPISDQIKVDADTGKLNLKGTGIDKAHRSYVNFQRATIGIVVVALLALVGAVLVSVHHLKTIRRILVGTGVMSLLLALTIEIPSFVAIQTSDVVTQKAVIVIMQSVFHNLQLAALIIGVLCIVGAVGSKLYEVAKTKKPRP